MSPRLLRFLLVVALLSAWPFSLPVRAEEHTSRTSDSLFFAPLGTPERTLWYDWIDRAISANSANSLDRFARAPYLVSAILLDSSRAYDWIKYQQTDLASRFAFGSMNQLERRKNALGYESFTGEFSLTPDPAVTFHLAGSLDEAKAKDPLYTGKKWRGLAGDLTSAVIGYHRSGVQLWLGRFGSSWGDRQSLLLSSEVSLDGLEYALTWKRLTLRYRLARLDGLILGSDSSTAFSNRYLAGHRLEYNCSNDLQFAFGEMVVFGGPGRTVDFGYLNPLLFFHGAQLNENVNDNTLLFADVTVRPLSKTRLFGQIVIDDFQIDHSARGDKEPAEYALRGVLKVADIVDKTDLDAIYTRVTNWTYNQIDPRNRYSFEGRPIAAVRGNDYDEWSLSVSHWFTQSSRLRGSVLYRRQGEGRITAQWTEPWILSTGTYSEPFPTGIVESLVQPSISYDGYLASWLFLNAEAGFHLLTNEKNVSGANASRPFINLHLTIPVSFTIPVS